MSDSLDTVPPPPMALSPGAVVRITHDGPVMATLTGRPAGAFEQADLTIEPRDRFVRFDFQRLELLRGLAAGEIVDAAAGLLAELRAGGLVGETRHEVVARADRVPWRTGDGAPTGEPVDLDSGEALHQRLRVGLTVAPEGFVWLCVDGTPRAVLSSFEVVVLGVLSQQKLPDAAIQQVRRDPALAGTTVAVFAEAVQRLAGLGLVRSANSRDREVLAEALRRQFNAYAESESFQRSVIEEERVHAAATGRKRAIVIPVDADSIPLLSLGTLVAYCRAFEGGRLAEDYRFAPLWYTSEERFLAFLPELRDWPVVFLFSDYVWTVNENLSMSALAKRELPGALTIHGGPELPKYHGDAVALFERQPSVDIGVRGEGEATLAAALAALAPAIPAWAETGDPPDLALLGPVAGLSYRGPTGLVRTEERDRIADLDTIPSPYLTGLFDHLDRRPHDTVTLETNRGCPYGCTFCDWGSATLSRIRKFDLDRVKAEMEWAARHGINVIGMADANFGILERDVELAEWAVELKARYGVPTQFQVTYAKNRVNNLTKIVRILADADILTQAAISVQTMDTEVLQIIRRKNLEIDRHVPLMREFEDLGLPLYTEVIIGLPGTTPDKVRADLQFCIDREIHIKAHPAQLLVNSPMNDPEYRAEHGIVAEPGWLVLEAKTFDRADWWTMMDMAEFMILADKRGLFRQLATYVRAETGLPEARFYDRLREAARDPERWPNLAYVASVACREFVPPGTWTPLFDEVGQFVVDELGIADDDALATVLAVQRALVPVPGRAFPEVLELPHDYAEWHRRVQQAKEAHANGVWVDHIEPLRTFPATDFELRDGDDCCNTVIGAPPRGTYAELIWELDTSVARSKQTVRA